MTDDAQHTNAFPPMPPKVAAALSRVMGKCEKLGKDENNPHANYKYAGIESFLEMLRPLCAEAGLLVIQDEEAFEFRAAKDKYGKDLMWLVMTFSFGLAHSSGETWPYRCRRTGMVQASMGSQAFGAAQSYTLKSFLRSIGLIATGDTEDADSHAQTDLPTKSAYQSRKDGFYPIAEKAIREQPSLESLKQWWVENQNEIRALPVQWIALLEEEKDRRKLELIDAEDASKPPPETDAGKPVEGGGSKMMKALKKSLDKLEEEEKQQNH